MKEFGFVWMACAALALFFIVYRSEHQRTAAIRALAIRSGLHFLGEGLPKSLTLRGTPFERASKIWNVIDGEPRGIRVIAFDCQVGEGKRGWRRSVICVESDADVSTLAGLLPAMETTAAGNWRIVYRPRTSLFEFRIAALTPVQDLEAYLSSIGADALKVGR